MANMDDLEAKVAALTAAHTAREARDVTEEEVAVAQAETAQATIAQLQAVIAAGGLSPEQQTKLDSAVANLGALVTSIEAADPTAPVIP